jgi:plasmid stabilization system protein ParE
MSLPIVLRRAARVEFDEAIDWYEQQRPGLGDDFAEAVQDVFNKISATPLIHATVLRDIRRGNVQRFPYSVYYRVKPKWVVVISVFHNRRDPRIWQTRS